MRDTSKDSSTSRGPIKRGRPRKDPLLMPKVNTSIMSKIMVSINKHPGQPILYASTTKGTMKLVVDGHHFRYSFRKGKYTIFQCCYKENKEECFVRVVTDQKLVYPLDGEHIHFVQAKDKSVTSVKFSPGKESESEFITIMDVQTIKPTQTDQKNATVGELMPRPTDIKVETTELETEKSTDDKKSKEEVISSEEFREKIKRRLQKALLGKKK